jgi:hypothetical protein
MDDALSRKMRQPACFEDLRAARRGATAFMMGCSECVIGCDLDYHQAETHVYGTGPIEQQRLA